MKNGLKIIKKLEPFFSLNFVEFMIFQIKAVIVRPKELLQQVKEKIAAQEQQKHEAGNASSIGS
jgi:hypothetical protein